MLTGAGYCADVALTIGNNSPIPMARQLQPVSAMKNNPGVLEAKLPLFALVPMTLLLSGWSTCNTEYDAPVFDVSEARIAAAFSRTTTCSRYDYIGGEDVFNGSTCHIQGISRFLGRTMTSCQDSSGRGQGILQLYRGWLGYYDGDSYAYQPTKITPPAMRGDRDHPAVGQALEPLSNQPADVLVPIVAASHEENNTETTVRVELRDGNGVLQCGFTHDEPADQHLGAVALHAVADRVYMAACSWGCKRFYIYELIPTAAGCGARILSDTNSDSSAHFAIPGTRDKNWREYNSLAVFRTEEGSIYLVAGYEEWLDTWRIDSPTSDSPSFHKIATANWGSNQANHFDKKMLHEGMTLEQLSSTSAYLWMAPHDYGTSGCDGIECTRAIYRCYVGM